MLAYKFLDGAYWSAVLAGELVAGRRDGPDFNRVAAAERALQAEFLTALLALVPDAV